MEKLWNNANFFCDGIGKVVYRRANSVDEQGYNKIKIQ